MRFIKFSKIKNIDGNQGDKFLSYCQMHGLTKGKWFVSEKVHGSNFIIAFDGNEFKCARRKNWLGSDEKHYNYKQVLENNKTYLQHIFDSIKSTRDIKFVTFYGEIFGGNYPHPEVKQIDEAISVQNDGKLYYCPDNRLYLFDILIVDQNNNEKMLAVSEFSQLCEDTKEIDEIGVMYAKNIFVGSLQDCLNFPEEWEKFNEWSKAKRKIVNKIIGTECSVLVRNKLFG